MLPKKAICLLLTAVSIVTVAAQITGPALFFHNKDHFHRQNSRSVDDSSTINLKQDSGFNMDVLNRFLEEFASKMKRTTERPNDSNNNDSKFESENQDYELALGIGTNNSTEANDPRDASTTSSDTFKKHKLYNAEPENENRNSGWVTLDAIPWSKSKISKWQANPTTQVPWLDSKPWDKPSYNKPWNTEFPSRPSPYENNKPWHNKLTKPHWSDNSPAASNKPWYSQDRPRPPVHQQDRPYPTIEKYEENPNQAQKWPPERPTWDRYGDSPRPPADIITDNGPPNFPNTHWDRPGQRPGYSHHPESYPSDHGGWNDRNDFSNNNNFNRPSNEDSYYDRPHFPHYQYPNSNDHPSNHPSSGDGQWVILSTNRGYSKTRQRSMKLDDLTNSNTKVKSESKKQETENSGEKELNVPIVTSKRQVRLTVLPSIDGNNTTTSHGGLLEVERTFKTVDQSQKEYEMEKISNSDGIKSSSEIMINRRPIRNTIVGNAPSSSAVLAAVGAGMLPATMAMMIPIMLGRRRKRSVLFEEQTPDAVYVRVPMDIFVREVERRRI